MNVITQTILASIGAVNSAPIIAHFRNGREVEYTAAIFDDLKTDNSIEYILDGMTGEVIYERIDD